MNPSNAIVPLDQQSAIEAVKALAGIVYTLRYEVLKIGHDYGKIPGTDKPTLLLPGMEKLMRALNAVPEYIERCVIRDYDKPLFHYEYECRLIDSITGQAIPGGRGIGLCTSHESAFRWRWMPADLVATDLDLTKLYKRDKRKTITEFAFAIDQAVTDGQYGKPAEYWQMWQDAIQSGEARAIKRKSSKGKELDAYEMPMGVVEYRVPNPDIFDQVNAIAKRAKKRALGDAIKGAANVSEFFTVDLEDFAGNADVVEGEFTEVDTSPTNEQPKPTEPTKRAISNPLPAAWHENERGVIELIKFVVGRGHVPQGSTRADIERLLGKPFSEFASGNDVATALRIMREEHEKQTQSQQPMTITRTGKVGRIVYRGKHIAIGLEIDEFEDEVTIFSRSEIYDLIAKHSPEWADHLNVKNWEGSKEKPFIHSNPMLIATYIVDMKGKKLTDLAPAKGFEALLPNPKSEDGIPF